jgi:lysosomal acid lipase/cholesteryl ester hydrolase
MPLPRFHTTSIFLISSLAILCAGLSLDDHEKKALGYPRDSILNFTEIASGYGYLTEEHSVVTEDGYILKVFRVAKGRHCYGKNRLPPVFLMHGLLQSSATWLSAGPYAGLAYLISDACFDLWVGNCRGNYYSRSHITLNPDKDPQFWQFSVDEIGFYDVSAMVDYVLDYVGVDKLNYIGFSQGAGTFFVMCSERPEYCDKINLMIGLAPATRQLNTRSAVFRFVTEAFYKHERIIRAAGLEEVFSRGAPVQESLAFVCRLYEARDLCNLVQGVLDAFNPGSVSNETTRVLYGHFPAGTSTHNMARFGQSMTRKDFGKFDYGPTKNLRLYGSAVAPRYNLKAVKVPVVIVYGRNDGLVDLRDVKWAVRQLPNVIDAVEVKDPLWSHLDVSYSQYNSKYLFPTILKYLNEFSFSY